MCIRDRVITVILLLYIMLVFGTLIPKKLASVKTAKSILISCGARLAVFDIAELREVTSAFWYRRTAGGGRTTGSFRPGRRAALTVED